MSNSIKTIMAISLGLAATRHTGAGEAAARNDMLCPQYHRSAKDDPFRVALDRFLLPRLSEDLLECGKGTVCRDSPDGISPGGEGARPSGTSRQRVAAHGAPPTFGWSLAGDCRALSGFSGPGNLLPAAELRRTETRRTPRLKNRGPSLMDCTVDAHGRLQSDVWKPTGQTLARQPRRFPMVCF